MSKTIPIREERRPLLLDLVQQALEEQNSLTAVERFARRHGSGILPEQAKYYRDLIPLDAPGEGEQYAFEVDLDACTSCKSCVSACHHLNGLDDQESWRSVGLLHGGSDAEPVQKTVTTACHHCLDPACLNGCPSNAYHKDTATGIVVHLDDQCIGCKYCTLTCPYEVPQYNPRLGIVRKCNMCQPRLAAGEAPACVQACPNQVIRIKVVSRREVTENAEAGSFLPGAPEPGKTLPATHYKTHEALPHNLMPADYHSVRPSHSHLPLVFMLVLTQLSVGAFAVQWALQRFLNGAVVAALSPFLAVLSFLLGQVALAASLFHLGRPLQAFRAVLGLRTSWLSREIVAFGVYSALASLYALSFWMGDLGRAAGLSVAPELAPHLRAGMESLVALSGLIGVGTSVMVYRATRRVYWDRAATVAKFFLTSLVTGSAFLLFLCMVYALAARSSDPLRLASRAGSTLAVLAMGGTALKLAFECSVLAHLRDRRLNPLKRTALLLTGVLKPTFLCRLALGAAGGLLAPLPFLLIADWGQVSDLGLKALSACSALSLILVTAGELAERYLFFTAEASDKMPGAFS